MLTCLGSVSLGAKKVTIRWMTWLAGDQLIDYKKLIDLFEKQNPDIEVKIESYPGDYNQSYQPKILTMFAAGVLPDVLHTTLYSADDLIEAGVFYNVAPLIKESGFDFKKYLPFSPTYVRGDKIWGGLETHFQTYPLYYNVEHFDERGISSPNEYYKEGRWNWSTFLDVARKLTVDKNADGRIDRFGYWTSMSWETGWYPWLLLNGASFIDPSLKKITIDSPEAISALKFWIDTMWKHGVAPKPGEAFTGFTQGGISMYISGTWDLYGNQLTAKCDWDIAPPPKGTQFLTYRAIGANGLISSTTKYPREAWKFVEFLLGPEAQMYNARSRLIQPMLLSALRSPEYLRTPPRHMPVILEMATHSIPQPIFRGFTQVISVIDRELSAAFNGKKPVEEAAKNAAELGNKELAKYLKK